MTRREANERWRAKINAADVLLFGYAGPLGKRYMDRSSDPVFFHQKDGRTYVETPADIGLRQIGVVVSEPYRYDNRFAKSTDDHHGWYTNDEGESWKDGDGLCWGVVYQLPARRGVMRVVAGYRLGGCDNGPTIDFKRIYEGPALGVHDIDPKDSDPAREAALHADEMARCAAELECEFQREQREEDEDEEDDDDARAA